MKHELKILPEFFESIVNWRKKAEFRKNDKNYRVNDILVLREYIPDIGAYTGRQRFKYISHVLELPDHAPEYVILSLSDFPVDANGLYCLNYMGVDIPNSVLTCRN